MRALSPPPTLPPRHELVIAKGPFTLQNELDLIDAHRLTHLVSKDSGGPDAKLRAAHATRPADHLADPAPGKAGPHVATVDEALRWVQASSSTSPRRK